MARRKYAAWHFLAFLDGDCHQSAPKTCRHTERTCACEAISATTSTGADGCVSCCALLLLLLLTQANKAVTLEVGQGSEGFVFFDK